MPFTITMPKLSPTMEEGTIVKWHKKEGDQIKEGDVLFEVATDKATVEYNALDPGFLRKILVAEGHEAKVNQPVAIFTETRAESIEEYKSEEEAPAKGKLPVKEKKKEEKLEAKSIESSMAAQPAFTPQPPLEKYAFKGSEDVSKGRVKASPLAKKMAEEQSIDLSGVKGSGPGGRIMSRDLKTAPHKATVGFASQKMPQVPPGSYEEEPLSPMRKIIGSRLQASKMYIPHYYVQQDVDAEALVSIREQLKTFGIQVTFNDLIIRACALALKEFPNINTGFNSASNTIIHFKTIDICVAVTVEGGLITPIIRYADMKNVVEISMEVKSLADLAKKGKLAPEQYQGGSFTISNLGMFGIKDFQAVINPPQAAILAVGGIQDKPIIRNGAVVPGKTLSFSISCDHRIIDGAKAAEFMRGLKKYIENPCILLI